MTTKYRRKKMEEGRDMIHLLKVGMVVFAAVGTLVGSVWAASEYVQTFATKNEIIVVQVQVQTLYDARIEQLTIQRDRILRKQKKTERDLQDLRDIEKELDLAKKMRASK